MHHKTYELMFERFWRVRKVRNFISTHSSYSPGFCCHFLRFLVVLTHVVNLFDFFLSFSSGAVSAGGRGGSTKYSAVIFAGKSKLVDVQFASHDELVSIIQEKWNLFTWTKFSLMVKTSKKKGSKNVFEKIDENLGNLVTGDKNHIIATKLAKGFSKFTNEQEVLGYLNAVSTLYEHIKQTEHDVDFPDVPSSVIPPTKLLELANAAMCELRVRKKVEEVDNASEQTMREFISPILIWAVSGMIDYLRQETREEVLKLSCEKKIVGRSYNGPVDYTIIFDALDIVLTEAKKGELKDGVLQNLLQLRSGQEFLANALVTTSLTGKKREQEFDNILEDIVSVPSFGVVSNGKVWIFTKTVCDPIDGFKSTIVRSHPYPISLDQTDLNVTEISKVISKITQIIYSQIQNIDGSEKYKRRKLHAKKVDINAVEMSVSATLDAYEQAEETGGSETEESDEE